MAPLPKRKYAKSRQGKRRSHLHLKPPHLVLCEHCRRPKLPHHACPHCGYYRGREVIPMETRRR